MVKARKMVKVMKKSPRRRRVTCAPTSLHPKEEEFGRVSLPALQFGVYLFQTFTPAFVLARGLRLNCAYNT